MKRFGLCIALLLAACVETPVPPTFDAYRYAPPIALDVASVSVTEEPRARDVSDQFPIPLTHAVRTWAQARLQAKGNARRLEVLVKEASAREQPLPVKQGVDGLLADEPSVRVDARVEIELRLYSNAALSDASVNVVATRSQTINEHASLAQRQQMMYEMTGAIMRDLDASLERNVREHFGNVLR